MSDETICSPHAMPVSGIARSLGADILRGLSDDEARKRLASFGPNRLRVHRRKRWQDILGHQFRSMLVWLLAGAAGFSFMLGDLVEGGAILAVLAINAAIGFGTELRAVRSMESLRRIAQVRTLVRRDGRNRKVDAGKVVPGDLVILEAGDIVTADLRLVRASNLESNESVLTGEPVPVAKATDPVAADAPVCDRVGMVFKGTAATARATPVLIISVTGWPWATPPATMATASASISQTSLCASRTGVALAVAAVPEG